MTELNLQAAEKAEIEIELIIEELKYYKEEYPDNLVILNKFSDKIEYINKQLKCMYQLVFIAEKGAGKTTVLDFLLGLTLIKEKINRKNLKKYEIEEDVLETGSGATTTSEVQIEQSKDEKNRIIIEPYDVDEMNEIICNFAQIIFNEVHHLSGVQQVYLPAEIIRACRNMTNLLDTQKKDEGKEDPAKGLAKQYASVDYAKFEKEVLRLSKIEERKVVEFECDSNNPKEWIKKTFRKINLVKISEAPLPKRVIIQLSQDIFDFSQFRNIDKIIDTRGLEIGSVTDRKDIQEIFRNIPNSIILFVDKFNSPSKSILDAMDHYVDDPRMEIINRIGYIVNFRDGEPEKVIGCMGEVGDEVEGIRERLIQITQNFKSNNINIKEQNILFSNPRRYLDEEGQIKMSADDFDDFNGIEDIVRFKRGIREENRLNFENEIVNIVNEYHIFLEKELEKVIQQYNNIKNEIDQKSFVDFKVIFEHILNKEVNFNIDEKLKKLFDMYIKAKHHSILYAINNRCGIYDNYDVFCEGANSVEKLIRNEIRNLRDEIINLIYEIVKNKEDLNNNQLRIINIIVDEINQYFFEYIRKINEHFYNKFKKDIYSKEEQVFWQLTQSRWGKGSGYKDDIAYYYKEQLIKKEFINTFANEIRWSIDTFKNGIINILEQ